MAADISVNVLSEIDTIFARREIYMEKINLDLYISPFCLLDSKANCFFLNANVS
jgi:hypothetical protein